MEIYLKTDLGLDELASTVRRLLGFPAHNDFQSQKRNSNWWGEYYRFKRGDHDVLLIENTEGGWIDGDVRFVEERAEWPYYLWIEERFDMQSSSRDLASLYASKLAACLEAEVDDVAN